MIKQAILFLCLVGGVSASDNNAPINDFITAIKNTQSTSENLAKENKTLAEENDKLRKIVDQIKDLVSGEKSDNDDEKDVVGDDKKGNSTTANTNPQSDAGNKDTVTTPLENQQQIPQPLEGTISNVPQDHGDDDENRFNQ